MAVHDRWHGAGRGGRALGSDHAGCAGGRPSARRPRLTRAELACAVEAAARVTLS